MLYQHVQIYIAYLIQDGRECCKWLVKLSKFIDLYLLSVNIFTIYRYYLYRGIHTPSRHYFFCGFFMKKQQKHIWFSCRCFISPPPLFSRSLLLARPHVLPCPVHNSPPNASPPAILHVPIKKVHRFSTSTNATVTAISVEIKRFLSGHFANQVIEVEQASSKSTYTYTQDISNFFYISVHEDLKI